MNRKLPIAAAAVALAASLSACSYNESLGRNQLLLVNEASLASAAQSAWAQTLSQKKLSTDPAVNARVRTVGSRIVQAAGMGGQRWEYAVFVDDTPNAFALPGGKIGVNTGLLDIVANDDQLAAVIGHEVGHSLAHHAAERMSQQAATQIGLGVAQSALGGGGSERASQIAALGGIGAQVGLLLPYSRRHELEADRLGVDYMARAGYDPRQALALWQMMATRQGGSRPPPFMSTHPTDADRIGALRDYLASRGWL